MQSPKDKPKREIRSYSHEEKVLAALHVQAGKTKAQVGRDIGVAESTIRGWLKAPAVIESVKNYNKAAGPAAAAPFAPAMINFCESSPTLSSSGALDLSCCRSRRNYASSESEVSDSGVSCSNSIEFDTPARHLERFSSWSISREIQSRIAAGTCSRALKRPHPEWNSDGNSEDLPAKRHASEVDMTTSSQNSYHKDQEVDDLESRHWKQLLFELANRSILSHDLFVYLWETLQ